MVLFDRSTQIKIDTRAPSSNSLYILPFAATPPVRPKYLGPVVMQIPDAQLTNVRMDGTTSGGGGLVDTLDFAWTEKGQYALRAGAFVSLFGGTNVVPSAVQPQSIASAGSVPGPTLSGTSVAVPTGAGYTSYSTIFSAGMTFKQVLNAVPAGNILTLPAGTYNVGSDFTDGYYSGCVVPTNVAGIWGSGVDATILQLTPNSSTQASYAAGLAQFDTNECHVMDVNHSNFLLKNLQFKGTAQGHSYNGLRMGNGSVRYQTGCTIDTVKFLNAGPGYANYPPGETFQVDANWTDGLQIINCEVDGRDPSTGTPSSGAGIGFNACTNSLVQDSYVHHAGFSHGITWWRCSGVHTLRVRSEFNGTGSISTVGGAALNHEQVDGTVLHESLTAKAGYTTSANRGLHVHWLNNDGTHTAATAFTVNGVTHDAGPDPGGCFSVYNWSGVPMTIIKNGVHLTSRTSGTGDPNTEYFTYT